jgi:GDP-L-fucose synthase
VKKHNRILITGANGMVGHSLIALLRKKGYNNLLTPTKKELNLLYKERTVEYFLKYEPEYVFHLAAKLGGIKDNKDKPLDYLMFNSIISINMITAITYSNIMKIVCFNSSCVYPSKCTQPMRVKDIMSGPFEKTNEGYSIAKLVSLKLNEYLSKQYNKNIVNMIPCNLYGPYSDFDLETSHVIPALIKKIDDAKNNNIKEIEIFGSGTESREFMYSDDTAEAALFLMLNYNSPEPINVGSKEEVSVLELINMISEVIGWEGEVITNKKIKSGMNRKTVDSSKITKLCWKAKTKIKIGIIKTYNWYKEGK